MDYREAVEQAQELFDSVANTKRIADALFDAYEAGRADQPRQVLRREVVAFCEAHGLKVVQIDSDAIAEYLASRGEVTVSAESWRKFQAWQQSSSVDLNEEAGKR